MRNCSELLVFLFFILISQCSECQTLWKINSNVDGCPPAGGWVLEDADLNGDVHFERVRVVPSIPSSVSDPTKFPGYWEGDCFRITIEDFTKDLIYAEDFCSAYGKFTIYIVNLSAGTNLDLIFDLYKNRGTNVTERYFIVKHWDGKKLDIKAIIPAGMWINHMGTGPLATYSSVPVYCGKELKLTKVSDKQYEAIILLDPDCMEIRKYLLPKTAKQREFITKVTQKIAYDSKTNSFYLLDVNP